MNDKIKLLRQKDFIFVKELEQGGAGKTILIKDEEIDELFVCQKYSPYYSDDKAIYHKYFLYEIKILHTPYRRNIVRVFNYYLYANRQVR